MTPRDVAAIVAALHEVAQAVEGVGLGLVVLLPLIGLGLRK